MWPSGSAPDNSRHLERGARTPNSLIFLEGGSWHAICLAKDMQSKLIALLAAEGNREATLLVRRGDGQFALARIDARVASAVRLAARYAPASLNRAAQRRAER